MNIELYTGLRAANISEEHALAIVQALDARFMEQLTRSDRQFAALENRMLALENRMTALEVRMSALETKLTVALTVLTALFVTALVIAAKQIFT